MAGSGLFGILDAAPEVAQVPPAAASASSGMFGVLNAAPEARQAGEMSAGAGSASSGMFGVLNAAPEIGQAEELRADAPGPATQGAGSADTTVNSQSKRMRRPRVEAPALEPSPLEATPLDSDTQVAAQPSSQSSGSLEAPGIVVLVCDCGRKLRVKSELAGKRVKCPGCSARLKVPGEPPAAAAAETASGPAEETRQAKLADVVAEAVRETPPELEAPPLKRVLKMMAYRRVSQLLKNKKLSGSESADKRKKAIEELVAAEDARGVELLLPLLTDEWISVREAAAIGLGKLRDPRAATPLLERLNDDSPEVRRAALNALGHVGDVRAVKPLLLAGLEDPHVRFTASESVARLGKVAIRPLMKLAEQGDGGLRLEVAVALGKIQGAEAVGTLAQLLRDRHSVVRAHAAEALGKIGGEDAAQALLKGLTDDDPSVRSNAAAALGKIADKRTAGPLTKLLGDSDGDVRARAVVALGKLKESAAVPALVACLQDEDPELRSKVAEALGEIADPRATTALIAVANDARHVVRQRVAEALGQIRDARALETLQGLLADPEELVRLRVVEALGNLGDARAIPDLQAVLAKGRTTEIRMAAARGLGAIRNPKALDALQDALNDEFAVRCRAVIALGEIGSKLALPSLLAMLKDPVAEVRYHATAALGEIGDANALKPLENLLHKDDDPLVLRGAAKALQQLGDPRGEKLLAEATKRKGKRSTQQRIAKYCPSFLFLLADAFRELSPRTLQIVGGGFLAVVLAVLGLVFVGNPLGPKVVIRVSGPAALAVTSDGKTLFIAGELEAFQAADIATGKIWRTIFGHKGGSECMALSPAGNFVATGGREGGIVLRNPASGKPVRTIVGHKASVAALRFNQDGSRLASWSRDGFVYMWDVATGRTTGGVQLPSESVLSVSISPSLKHLAVGTKTGAVYVFDVDKGELLRTFQGSEGGASAVAISPDNKLIAVATDMPGPILIAPLDGVGQEIRLEGHGFGTFALEFSPDGRKLASGSANGVAKIWTLSDGSLVNTDETLERYDAFAFTPDGNQLIGGGREITELAIWDVSDGKLVRPILN